MAIIKHISSKNANYGAAELYLTFQHDEQTGKPLLDEHGHNIPREEYLISGVLSTPDNFALDCVKANLRYKQNQKKGDIKTHHYIISFDPRDRDDHHLTLEEVQKMGEDFCRQHFPGHQALVCSHPDGHHGTGNLHCHIVLNSLRIQDVERKPYMDRPCDSRAGAKHRCTGKLMRYLREQVMAMCEERGLYQIDLLSGAQKKVTDREYHAQQRGQVKLDKENALLVQQGKTPKETIFDTQKEELRQAIDATWPKCSTLTEFVQRLFQDYGIETTESRGRFSYLHPNAKKKVADRRLGEGYRKGVIQLGIDEQNHRRERPERGEQGTAFVVSAEALRAAAQLSGTGVCAADLRRIGADIPLAGAGQAGPDLADHQPTEQAGAGEQLIERIPVQPDQANGGTGNGAEAVLQMAETTMSRLDQSVSDFDGRIDSLSAANRQLQRGINAAMTKASDQMMQTVSVTLHQAQSDLSKKSEGYVSRLEAITSRATRTFTSLEHQIRGFAQEHLWLTLAFYGSMIGHLIGCIQWISKLV